MKTIHKRPGQTHTSIGPSDQSEEACPSMMIDRCQTGSNMRERAVKVPLHLHRNPRPHGINSQMLSLREQSRTHTQGTHDAPRNEQEHILAQGSFTLPCIPLLSLSSPQFVNRGFCIDRGTDTKTH